MNENTLEISVTEAKLIVAAFTDLSLELGELDNSEEELKQKLEEFIGENDEE